MKMLFPAIMDPTGAPRLLLRQMETLSQPDTREAMSTSSAAAALKRRAPSQGRGRVRSRQREETWVGIQMV